MPRNKGDARRMDDREDDPQGAWLFAIKGGRRGGNSRLRYQELEAGRSAARTATLINIGRAMGTELMLAPQVCVLVVNALLRPNNFVDDTPGPVFTQLDDDGDEQA